MFLPIFLRKKNERIFPKDVFDFLKAYIIGLTKFFFSFRGGLTKFPSRISQDFLQTFLRTLFRNFLFLRKIATKKTIAGNKKISSTACKFSHDLSNVHSNVCGVM